MPLSAVPQKLGGDRADKPLPELIAELVADGFPRAARPWKPPATASDSPTREPSRVPLEIDDADVAAAAPGPNRARMAAKGVGAVAAGGLLAYAGFALATSMMMVSVAA